MKDNHKIIKVCHGRSCGGVGKYIHDRLIAEAENNQEKKTFIEKCPCRGLCAEGPIVVEEKGEKIVIHKKMDPIRASKLL